MPYREDSIDYLGNMVITELPVIASQAGDELKMVKRSQRRVKLVS